MYEPLHHKYRPQTFAQLVGQGAIAATLINALQQNRIAPAYLFCGPRGTGKTSSARILAKSLNCLTVDAPTAEPCGQCDVCQSVTKGSSLDIVEIDAASNTGVDNIRELIERSQFAPVQCRYKVYVIDECLTGDTQILTDAGTIRIDDPRIVGRKVLSYNESSDVWEFKSVVRRFEQGTRQTYTIVTDQFKIKCTDNHLIRTDAGWVAAKDVKEGMKILSPANADVGPRSSNTEQMGAFVDSFADISSKETNLARSLTASVPFSKLLSPIARCAPADAVSVSKSRLTCGKKATALRELSLDGKAIHLRQSTTFGFSEPKTSSLSVAISPQRAWASSTEPGWETDLSLSPILTVDSQDWLGLTENRSSLGWNTKPADYLSCAHPSELRLMKATETSPFAAIPSVILSWLKSSILLSQIPIKKAFQWLGWSSSRLKALLGGIWTMGRSNSQNEARHPFKSIQKASAWKAISCWLAGCPIWDIPQKFARTDNPKEISATPTLRWGRPLLESFYQTSDPSQSHQWHTSLETVRSVEIADIEPVYDIEVADNHNFVANGLLVHNCHMLSTAAFNALLKTLEEPPDRVVFVLATTDPQRVLPTIISRCQRFDFRRIPLPSMIEHLQYIATEEQIAIASSATQLVAQISQGGLRDAESLLDQLSLQADEISVESVWDLVGAVPERDLLNLVRAIAADDGTALLERVRQLMDKGREPLIVLQSLVGFYRDLLIAKRAPTREDLVAITPPTWAEMTDFAQQLSVSQLLASQQKLQTSEVQVKNTTQPRLWLEVTLTGLLPSALGAMADLASSAAQSNAGPRAVTQVNVARSPLAPPPITTPVAKAIAPIPPAVSPAVSPPSPHPVSAPEAAPLAPSVPAVVPAPLQPPTQPASSSAPSASPAVSPTESGVTPPQPDVADTDSSTDATSPPPSAPAVNFGSLADLWNKILAVLLPRGTQILMAQQGVLLGFDGVGAKVGFRSASLQKLAQSRVPNLETAFESVFQRKIKVSLEVVTPEESPVVEVAEPAPAPPAPPVTRTQPDNNASTPAAPSDAAYTQPSSLPPTVDSSAPPQGDLNSSAPHRGGPSNSDSSARYPSPGPTSTNEPPTQHLPPAAYSPPPSSSPGRLPSENTGSSRLDAPSGARGFDQDQEKVKRFANFFNGEIVNLDGSEPSDISNHASKKSSDPGPDVPF